MPTWSKVAPNCMNGVWKKLWPKVCNLEAVEVESIIQNTVELANNVGLEGVNKEDVEELL